MTHESQRGNHLMDLKLQNQVVVVTGAASGIGRAIAEGFIAERAHVALWDLSENVLDVAAAIEPASGPKSLGLQVDITDEAAVAEALERTERELGPVEHLVHAAAMGSGKFGFPFSNLQPGDWRKVIDVNVMGMVHVAHAVSAPMVARRSGTMLFLASVAGQIGSQTDPPYSASKAANINFAQCLAKDLAEYDIRVNSLCPGMVKTPLNKGVWRAWNDGQPAEEKKSYEQWAAEKIQNVVPLRRWQEPCDIADMAVFLSSERAANVTGQTINVDGGFVMH